SAADRPLHPDDARARTRVRARPLPAEAVEEVVVTGAARPPLDGATDRARAAETRTSREGAEVVSEAASGEAEEAAAEGTPTAHEAGLALPSEETETERLSRRATEVTRDPDRPPEKEGTREAEVCRRGVEADPDPSRDREAGVAVCRSIVEAGAGRRSEGREGLPGREVGAEALARARSRGIERGGESREMWETNSTMHQVREGLYAFAKDSPPQPHFRS
ncbi:hypothetical protein P7C73_g5457, partial [Tremellales sp. Uapishka_1]